jgi:hypothetical protein
MVDFVEKTLAERGFGVSWSWYVAPVLEHDSRRVRRRIVFAVATSFLSLVLAAIAIVMHANVNDAMILAQPLNTALVVALAALAVIGSWVVVLQHASALAAPVRAAVESHFGALFTKDDNAAFGEVILQDLVADEILDDLPYSVAMHYAGTYSDCRIRLIEASANLGRRMTADLLVLRVSLPFSARGEIRGDSDIRRLKAFVEDREDVDSFYVDHDQFDRIFMAACTDLGEGVRIVTRGFAETVLQIQHRLASPLDNERRIDPRVAFQIAGGSLTVIVESRVHRGRRTRLGRTGAESLARELVMRFATAPALVDELHGEADVPPAFKPLPRADEAQPQISL